MPLFFKFYQVLMPLLGLPLSCYLWRQAWTGSSALLWLVFSIPVLFGYVGPLIGTQVLGLYEFKTPFKLGKLTLLHGFMFGAASSLLAWATLSPLSAELSLLGCLRSGFLLGSVLGLCNWVFDIWMVQAGIAVVYNKPHALGQPPAAIVADYAPVYFGAFGFCYGVALEAVKGFDVQGPLSDWRWSWLVLFHAAAIGVPALAFAVSSWFIHGHSGLRPYRPGEH